MLAFLLLFYLWWFPKPGVHTLQPAEQFSLLPGFVNKFFMGAQLHPLHIICGSFSTARAQLNSYGRDQMAHKIFLVFYRKKCVIF